MEKERFFGDYEGVRFEDITKAEFEAYEWVRASGVIDMYNADAGCKFSGLGRHVYIGVMENYGSLMKKYPGVRK